MADKSCTANDSRLGSEDSRNPQNMLSNPPSNLTSNQLPRSDSPDDLGINQLSLNHNSQQNSCTSTSTSYLPNSHPVYNWQATKTTVSTQHRQVQ